MCVGGVVVAHKFTILNCEPISPESNMSHGGFFCWISKALGEMTSAYLVQGLVRWDLGRRC